jgi:hypothetical protein
MWPIHAEPGDLDPGAVAGLVVENRHVRSARLARNSFERHGNFISLDYGCRAHGRGQSSATSKGPGNPNTLATRFDPNGLRNALTASPRTIGPVFTNVGSHTIVARTRLFLKVVRTSRCEAARQTFLLVDHVAPFGDVVARRSLLPLFATYVRIHFLRYSLLL